MVCFLCVVGPEMEWRDTKSMVRMAVSEDAMTALYTQHNIYSGLPYFSRYGRGAGQSPPRVLAKSGVNRMNLLR